MTYEDAQYAVWAYDALSNSEREEFDSESAGKPDPENDRVQTELADMVAEDMRQATCCPTPEVAAMKLCGCWHS